MWQVCIAFNSSKSLHGTLLDPAMGANHTASLKKTMSHLFFREAQMNALCASQCMGISQLGAWQTAAPFCGRPFTVGVHRLNQQWLPLSFHRNDFNCQSILALTTMILSVPCFFRFD
jgi:hypothetical protein